jgi:uncharacterized membrane protein YbaN (DUF454 family)
MFAAGIALLICGLAGVVVPFLPSAPFLLLASRYFALSSPKTLNWMLHDRIIGPYIEYYRDGKPLSVGRKAAMIAVMWVGFATSAYFLHQTWYYVVAGLMAVGLSLHFLFGKPHHKPNLVAPQPTSPTSGTS